MSSGQHRIAEREKALADFKIGQTVYLANGSKATVTNVLWSTLKVVVRRDGEPGEETMYPSDLSTTPPTAVSGVAHVVALEKRVAALENRSAAQTPRHKELVATFGRGVGADVYIAELLTERDAAARDIADLRAARDAAMKVDASELHECLADLVRRAAGEIKDRTLREALLADLEALLHPRKS